MKSPVLFIIFKRYDTALKVFNSIREARPPRLYIAADAPRKNVEHEVDDCNKTRSLVNLIDWPCEVKTLFQIENQGCGIGPYKAISWFFENEEQGIILEDDCVPHKDFFAYMDEMLEYYKYDNKISVLTGRNVKEKSILNDGSYFMSGLHFCWGWASWRRVWNHYDYTLNNVKFWSYVKKLYCLFGFHPLLIMWRLNIFFNCKLNPQLDAWDYQFAIATQMLGTYTIVPCINLVQNIGFDERATHTTNQNHIDISAHPILPIHHPKFLHHSIEFDVNACRISNRLHLITVFLRSCIKYFFTKI